VGLREEAAAPVGGTKQVDGWGKDVASARTRHGQDKLCRRWCVGGGIGRYVVVFCGRVGRGGRASDGWMMMQCVVWKSAALCLACSFDISLRRCL